MPPRKRTTKAAQPSAEDAPKPPKRQRKSRNDEQVEEESQPAPAPALEPEPEPVVDEPAVVVNEPAAIASTFPETNDESSIKDKSAVAVAENGQQSGNVDEEEENLEDEPVVETNGSSRTSDLYLDTVKRMVLDFDFEKVCSVSLSNINIYGCLVCGKYFRGRSKLTPAFSHSIHDDHHVFINLETTEVSPILIPISHDDYHMDL
jgi:U4/U6.U5 tri-snRNP-associated protein 2